jgi:hypothetical protein
MKRPPFFYSNLVWPPPWLVWLFVFAYGFVTASLWLIERPWHGPGENLSDIPEIKGIRMIMLGIAAALYALFRLVRFHPICSQAYADWLKATPWTAARRLPLGPIHPVLQDAVVIGVLTVIARWHAHVDAALPVSVFAMVYLVGMTVLLAATRRWWSCLVLGFLWPALLLPSAEGWPSSLLLAAIVIVLWHGHRQSLKAFPWSFRSLLSRPNATVLQTEIRIEINNQAAALQSRLGWPFAALSPKISSGAVSHRTSICVSALLGWWSYCVIECARPEPLPELMMIFAFMAAVFRLGTYLNGTMPPFSLWSRVVWGRILVPGYDKVFLTPMLTALAGILGAILIKHSGNRVPESESAVFALIWYLLLSGGPTLRSWILTGQHGFRPLGRTGANKQLLRPL